MTVRAAILAEFLQVNVQDNETGFSAWIPHNSIIVQTKGYSLSGQYYLDFVV